MVDSTLDGFKKELAALNAKSEPLRQNRDKLADSIRPTEDKIRDLNFAIKEIEQPRKGELEKLIAALS
jgi:uncharacterized coiled-coil DUF342 family protein